jgi:hypothetical protein
MESEPLYCIPFNLRVKEIPGWNWLWSRCPCLVGVSVPGSALLEMRWLPYVDRRIPPNGDELLIPGMWES